MEQTSLEIAAFTPEAAPQAESTRNLSDGLAARIERQVRSETGDRIRALKVRIRQNSVVLEGNCPSFYCKQLAQHAAMPLAGPKLLNNRIRVR